jgi:hypothetical protein
MHPNSVWSILFIALLLSVFGCNAQKEFDREEAAKAITNSEKFKDCHTGINNWKNFTLCAGSTTAENRNALYRSLLAKNRLS